MARHFSSYAMALDYACRLFAITGIIAGITQRGSKYIVG